MSTGTATYDFAGAKVLVTGGTSGIGLATASASFITGETLIVDGGYLHNS